MSQERLQAEIKSIRKALGLSQERLVVVHGSIIGISNATLLSRYESGDRPISIRVLRGYAFAFPNRTAAIQRHLEWLTPVVKEDLRSIRVERHADGSFAVSEEVTTTVDLNYYLICHCRGRQVEQELRRRVPGLYGIQVWPADADLHSAVRDLTDALPTTFVVERPDASREQIELSLDPLSTNDVVELGGDLEGLAADDVLFYGASLEKFPGDKTFTHESTERRRSTLREWHWLATFPYKQVVHRIRMSVAPGQDLGGFDVHVFMPDALLARRTTATSLTVTIRTTSPISAGHGWIATWTNPPV